MGSNMGERADYLFEAIKRLILTGKIKLVNFSSKYETEPVGFDEQDCFLKMASEIQTDLTPVKLLETCLSIEQQLGRKRIIRWGPRTIDLDILLFNQEIIKTDQLTIPHPRMAERAFVLIPLEEMEPGLIVPEWNQTIGQLANTVAREGVQLWRDKQQMDFFTLLEQ